MVVLIWLVIVVLEQRDRGRCLRLHTASDRGAPLSAFALKFADGWICRACWTSNRAMRSSPARDAEARRPGRAGTE